MSAFRGNAKQGFKDYEGRPEAALCPDRVASLKTRSRIFDGYGPISDPEGSFRKEVIQPQVLLQLPCYDFTPITDHTVGACLPYGLAQRLLVQPAFVM